MAAGTPTPKELQVIQALVAHLEYINPDHVDPAHEANGFDPQNYVFDIRSKVFIGKTQIGADVNMPALAILEAPVPSEVLYGGYSGSVKSEGWKLLLQGFAEDDKANPTVPAYNLKAAVQMRLDRLIAINDRGNPAFPNEYMLGKLVSNLKIPQGVVRPPEQNISATAFFYIPLVIELTTSTSNPYAV